MPPDYVHLALPVTVLLWCAWLRRPWWRGCRRLICRWIGHNWCWLGLADVPYGAEEWQACRRCGRVTRVFLTAWIWHRPPAAPLPVPEFDVDEIPSAVTKFHAPRSPRPTALPSDGMECSR